MLDFIVRMIYNNTMTTKFDRPITFSTKIKNLDNLAKACANAQTDDFKKMWFDKLIDLAKKYDMRDFVMNKLVH